MIALDDSDYGMVLKYSLSPRHLKNWNEFKNHLISVLGKDSFHYRDEFKNFKRQGDCASFALARLTLSYKKKFPVEKEILSPEDEANIYEKCISSLEQPLQGMITSEEDRLDFHTVAA